VWKGNWVEWCSHLNQSKPLKRRRNSCIQLYCRQYAFALPLSNPRIIRSVVHVMLLYRLVTESRCTRPYYLQKIWCELQSNMSALYRAERRSLPTWNSRLPPGCRALLPKTFEFPQASPLGWPWCHSYVRQCTLAYGKDYPSHRTQWKSHRSFHCQKQIPGSSLLLARHKGSHSICVNYNPQYISNSSNIFYL
jgi:hypothetical protein